MKVSILDEAFATADGQVKEAEQAAKINSSVNRPWKATEMEVKKKKNQRKKRIIITH